MKKISFLAILIISLCFTSTLFAQKLPYDSSLDTKANWEKFNNMLKSGNFSREGDGYKFFTQCYFSRWIQAENVSKLDSYVTDFKNDLKSATGGARDNFLGMSLRVFKEGIVENTNAPPQARYLAMLMIGNMNQTENINKPVPYAPAFSVMLDEYSKKELPDAVRYAAFIGILRFMHLDVNDPGSQNFSALKNNAANIILAVAKEKDVPEGRSVDLHLFYRIRAIESLGFLKAYANKSLPLLLGIIQDNDEDTDIRYAATRSLGEFNLEELNLKKDAVDRIAYALVNLSKTACEAELEAINFQRRQEQASRSAPSGTGLGRIGGGSGYTDPFGGGNTSYNASASLGSMTEKEKIRIQNSINRIKFAFGSITGAIGTARDPKGRVNKLVQEDPATAALLKNVTAKLSNFNKFLDDGPEDLKVSLPSLVDESSTTNKKTTKTNTETKKELKVNELMIRNKLEELLVELDQLLTSPARATASI